MAVDRVAGAMTVALESWVTLHPAALAAWRGEIDLPPCIPSSSPRLVDLAEALSAANGRWGNPVENELARWRAGADVIVTGQQPGLFGGPMLTLVKAAAVAAEVARRRAAGRDAVGFLWLGTADDDLPEMGWARVAAGEELAEVRETGWERGAWLGGTAPLSDACSDFLASLRPQFPGENAGQALDLAARCYAGGTPLGEATAGFLAQLLAGTGVVLVDALTPAIARAAAPVTEHILRELPRCWEALEAGGERFKSRGWSSPLRISPQKLPLFRRVGDHRESVPTVRGACPPAVLAEHLAHPETFLPNAWLRPIVADVVLGTTVAILGAAELAYHAQTADARAVAGVARPEWRLRPHLTVLTSVERRLVKQLHVDPGGILSSGPPLSALPGKATRRAFERLRTTVAARVAQVADAAHEEISSLAGDVTATAGKLDAAMAWFEARLTSAATRDAEVSMGRWRRLQAFVRPGGRPQERELSVLAPLLRLGLSWPGQLAAALDPEDPGMHLLFWGEGGLW